MEEIQERVKKLLDSLNIPEKQREVRILEAESTHPDFWKEYKTAAEKMKKLSSLQKEIKEAEELESFVQNGEKEKAEDRLTSLEMVLYFSGTHDQSSAIVSIHAGQGGVEAMDWAEMLYRMYSRFFEKKGWSTEIIDQTPGEEAGIKSITLEVSGDYAYGNLKWEAGVHRLVRLSPYNADNLRQTSFAMVEVLPEVAGDEDLHVTDDDLKWEFFRSGGHGGQNVNKVSTAVRLIHIPTGIVVTAQSERYQGQNREYALKILKAKLWRIKEEERKKQEQALKGGYKTPGWGNQIRSYVLHPYQMVKDLRTAYETSDTVGVLNGNLEPLIEAELRKLT